jgi:hypothetical protein
MTASPGASIILNPVTTRALLLVLLWTSSNFPMILRGADFIDWNNLQNPVLSYPTWSIKDSAMAYRNGVFYVFFSAFYEDRSQVRSHVVEVSTRDFKTYSQPIFDFDGEEDGWLGMCSPDVQRVGDQYVMTFNSWGDKPGKWNALFYKTSGDLIHWSKMAPLAAELTAGKRVIDAAIARTARGYYAAWKEGQHGMKPRMAFAKSLDGPFQFVNSGLPELLMKDGKDDGLIHENYEFLEIDGRVHLLATDYNPPSPRLYTLENPADWLRWDQGYELKIPVESFNTDNVANAAALYDWRGHDGFFYLIYAGRTERASYLRRGWNRIGLARSKDLIHWQPAGKPE